MCWAAPLALTHQETLDDAHNSTIALNIVFGIIVDTFSELRNARYEIEEDRLNSCFICSLKGDEFERAGTLNPKGNRGA